MVLSLKEFKMKNKKIIERRRKTEYEAKKTISRD
jgi:hypothetical protein